jgi:di/tricarboxylate transporter
MTLEQIIVFGTLLMALVLFISGRLRYDIVALLALLVVTVTGIVPSSRAFAGFGHPAVITVAAVLVLSRGLVYAGVVDVVARAVARVGEKPVAQVGALSSVTMVCSAFMNNIGALALVMPVAIRLARRGRRSPSYLLMPLAFSSLLGGMVTAIGTPPNIIIASYRVSNGSPAFSMFDFTPVGLGVAVAGVLFVALVGWRLLPQRKANISREDLFRIKEYTSEVLVPEGTPLVGKLLRDIRTVVDVDVIVVALIRGEQQLIAPSSFEFIRAGDILVIEANPADLDELVDAAALELVGGKSLGEEAMLGSNDVSVMEAVVTADSPLRDMTARGVNMRWRYGVNLLAVARQGERLQERLGSIRFRVSDVLLLQGRTETLYEALPQLGLLPLADRGLRLGRSRRLLISVGIFGAALLISALGFLPIEVAFVAAAVVMVLIGLVPLRELYTSIDWPIIVLLAALIPVGEALETTGGAQLIADLLLAAGQHFPPVITLTMLLVGTMFLSDLINNAAAAVLMAPIGINTAIGLGASIDPFLMAVAIGASCAFLTPIGHQSNTLVMGPGGYKFGDYWRMGLPLEVIIVVIGVPLLTIFWPLGI